MGLSPFDTEIFPMMMIIRQWTPVAAEAAGGFNHTLREPNLVDDDGDGIGEPPAELYDDDPISVPGQVESNSIEALKMQSGGDLPSTAIMISFSRGRLGALNLINTDGTPKIKKADRLVRIDDMSGNKVWTFDKPDPLGLYCEEIKLSDAFVAGTSNWFRAMFNSRKKGPTQ